MCAGCLQIKNVVRSEVMCIVGSRSPRPLRIILLFPDLGETLDSSTRQEMQCCMTPVRPKFLSQLLSFLPRNFIDSGGKSDQRIEKNQLKGKS